MLTSLGIFIGVASVIWLLAIGEGISRKAQHCQRHARCDVLLVRDPAPEPEAVTQSVGNTS